MKWYSQGSEDVLKNLESSREGLTEEEVQKRFSKYGKNVLQEIKGKNKILMILSQFNSLLIYILIFAAVISAVIGHLIDSFIILMIVVLNSFIGFLQEYKAEEIIVKLRKSLEYKVRVLRDGVQKEIVSKLLVPGDIVLLDAGDRVLADCRILEAEGLEVNEAVLTGESLPVSKFSRKIESNKVLAERENMLYGGTSVVRGNSIAVVVETGRNTEFGKLAELAQTTKDEKMPLEKKISSFSKKISIAILIFVSFSFFVGLSTGIEIVEMFLVSVSLAIGAIPEGLPAIIAITLAVAIKQMYKVNTLIRKLPAAETLGRATVICTDKTGTLTEEELTVEEIYSGKIQKVSSLKRITNDFKQLLRVGILCNNARDENSNILGDPTEISLITVAKKFGLSKKKETEKNERIREFPFDSSRKMMSIVRQKGKIKTSYVKGAPKFILERCTKELVNGRIKLISKERRNELERAYNRMEEKGLRVLGFGFRNITKINIENAENHLILAGFQGMIDPPRKEVKKAIEEAVGAGIEIKIITGDSALTTRAIAEKIGIRGEIIDGGELSLISEDKWDRIVRTKTIFARTTPEQKLKIVEILKKNKEVVAVTGDGVNDILALKKADIGISMGIRGSDVARDSSDMVLLDDNFASIIKAIKQGRRIFDNMKKSIKFLLAANFGEVLALTLGLVLGWPLIFLPLAILWMNLVTDSLPALALAVEPAEENIMGARPKNGGLLTGVWHWVIIAGVLMVLSVVGIFGWARAEFGLDIARTMATSTAIFFQLFFVFSCKSEKSIFKTGALNNFWLLIAVGVSMILHILLIYSPLGSLFKFAILTWSQLGISILFSISGLIFFESYKFIKGILKK